MKLKRVSLRPNLKPRLKLKRNTVIKLGVGLGVLALTACIITFSLHELSSPAYGTILKQPTIKTLTTNSASKTPHIYSGQNFSFTIPGDFNIIPSKDSNANEEVVKLLSNDHTNILVAITVGRGSFSNDSGISYRRANPALYKEQSTAQGGIIFTKKVNGSEYTAFNTHNDLESTVSISSPYSNDLSSDYRAITKSWQWK